jgi:two-component system sensor histidine kinase PilS (NtrC family)
MSPSVAPESASLTGTIARDEAWRSLHTYGIYRILLSVILAGAYWALEDVAFIGGFLPWLARFTLVVYCALSLILFSFTRMRTPGLEVQLTTQVIVDVIAIVAIMHASGGIRSGIGLLLLAMLAAAGLVSRGRMVYFHASIGVIALLLEQSALVLQYEALPGEFFQAGLLSLGYFAIAWLAATLAKYARGAERIAEERGVDLANMAQINELVIRDMQDGFLVIDENGVIRQHNPQSEALLGPMKGMPTLAEYAPRLAVCLEEWRRDRGHVFPVTRDLLTQKDYQVRFAAIGQGQKSGKPSPTVIFVEDAGRIRAQAQQLKLAALGRLTASIAHEIRNPLSSIGHAADLMLDEAERGESDQRLLAIIRDNTQRLDRMVHEVLYLNRRDRAQPETFDGAAYLQQFVREFSGNEKVPEGVFRIDAQASQRLLFDRSHFDQVLWNLSRNAWRHCRRKAGSISMVLSPGTRDNTLQLDVIDDGPGVPTSALPHLFEPFFTTDAKGTGLGLYIARELSEVNGAHVDYLADEGGAHFRLTMRADRRLKPRENTPRHD